MKSFRKSEGLRICRVTSSRASQLIEEHLSNPLELSLELKKSNQIWQLRKLKVNAKI